MSRIKLTLDKSEIATLKTVAHDFTASFGNDQLHNLKYYKQHRYVRGFITADNTKFGDNIVEVRVYADGTCLARTVVDNPRSQEPEELVREFRAEARLEVIN